MTWSREYVVKPDLAQPPVVVLPIHVPLTLLYRLRDCHYVIFLYE